MQNAVPDLRRVFKGCLGQNLSRFIHILVLFTLDGLHGVRGIGHFLPRCSLPRRAGCADKFLILIFLLFPLLVFFTLLSFISLMFCGFIIFGFLNAFSQQFRWYVHLLPYFHLFYFPLLYFSVYILFSPILISFSPLSLTYCTTVSL